MKEKIRRIFMLLLISVFWVSISHSSLAATKSNVISDRLTFTELGSGGASLWTIIDVYSMGTEEYTKTGNNAKYSKRSVYAYGKNITASGHITYKVVPISHYDPNNNLLHTFNWSDEAALFPESNYRYTKKNSTAVTYSKYTSNRAQWSVIVSVDDSLVPAKARTASIGLNCASTK